MRTVLFCDSIQVCCQLTQLVTFSPDATTCRKENLCLSQHQIHKRQRHECHTIGPTTVGKCYCEQAWGFLGTRQVFCLQIPFPSQNKSPVIALHRMSVTSVENATIWTQLELHVTMLLNTGQVASKLSRVQTEEQGTGTLPQPWVLVSSHKRGTQHRLPLSTVCGLEWDGNRYQAKSATGVMREGRKTLRTRKQQNPCLALFGTKKCPDQRVTLDLE